MSSQRWRLPLEMGDWPYQDQEVNSESDGFLRYPSLSETNQKGHYQSKRVALSGPEGIPVHEHLWRNDRTKMVPSDEGSPLISNCYFSDFVVSEGKKTDLLPLPSLCHKLAGGHIYRSPESRFLARNSSRVSFQLLK